MIQTIKDLKEKIAFIDDNMRIGGSGHFGEFLECVDIEVRTVTKSMFNPDTETILCITIESPER